MLEWFITTQLSVSSLKWKSLKRKKAHHWLPNNENAHLILQVKVVSTRGCSRRGGVTWAGLSLFRAEGPFYSHRFYCLRTDQGPVWIPDRSSSLQRLGEGENGEATTRRFSRLPPVFWGFFLNRCPVFPGGCFPPPDSKFQSEKDHLAPAEGSLAVPPVSAPNQIVALVFPALSWDGSSAG